MSGAVQRRIDHAASRGNTLSAGRWQTVPLDDDRVPLSVEAELARDLGLSVGDEVGLQVAGEPVRGVVQSIRQVPWRNMRSNFLVVMVAEPGERWPHQYLATLRTQDREASPAASGASFADHHGRGPDPGAAVAWCSKSPAPSRRSSSSAWLAVWSCWARRSTLPSRAPANLCGHEGPGAGRSMLARMQGWSCWASACWLGRSLAPWRPASARSSSARPFKVSLVLPWWWWPLSVGGGALLAWGAGRLGLKGLLDEPVVESLRRLGGR